MKVLCSQLDVSCSDALSVGILQPRHVFHAAEITQWRLVCKRLKSTSLPWRHPLQLYRQSASDACSPLDVHTCNSALLVATALEPNWSIGAGGRAVHAFCFVAVAACQPGHGWI